MQYAFEKTMIKKVEKNIDIMKELHNENEITYHEKYPGCLCTILSVSYDDQAQVNNTRSYVIQITKKSNNIKHNNIVFLNIDKNNKIHIAGSSSNIRHIILDMIYHLVTNKQYVTILNKINNNNITGKILKILVT